MYLHLGDNVMVNLKDIIGIFSMEEAGNSSENIAFLNTAQDEGFIRRISEDYPRSFVVTEQDHKAVIWLSPISTQTLIRRADPATYQEDQQWQIKL